MLGWFLSIMITVLPAFWQFNNSINISTKQTINLIYATLLFGCTILAGMFMMVVYWCIVRTVGKKLQRGAGGAAGKQVGRAGVKVCIVCTVVYFTSWLQYCAVEILLQHHIHLPGELMDASYFLLMLSPCLDCVLYAYYRQEFRNCLLNKWKEVRTTLRVALRYALRHTRRDDIDITPEVIRMCRLANQDGDVSELSHALSGMSNDVWFEGEYVLKRRSQSSYTN